MACFPRNFHKRRFGLNFGRRFLLLAAASLSFAAPAAAESFNLPQPPAQIVHWDQAGDLCASADLFANAAERARLEKLSLIYFGDPYSTGTHQLQPEERQAVLNWRYYGIYKATEWSYKHGYHVFAPIVVNYGMDLPMDAGFWNPWNKQFMAISQEMWFLPMQGWRQSGGLKEELDWAFDRKIPVRVLCKTASGYSLHNYSRGE